MNLVAAQNLVKALRGAGRIPEDGDALVQIVLGLAGAVDADPENASLWREYRAAEQSLRGLVGGEESDAFDDWLRAQVADTEDGPAHARAEVRGDS